MRRMRGLKTRRLAQLRPRLARMGAREATPFDYAACRRLYLSSSGPPWWTKGQLCRINRLHNKSSAKLICAKRACIFLRFAAFAECAARVSIPARTPSIRPPPGTPAYGGLGTPGFGRGVGTSEGTPLAPAPQKGAETGDKITRMRGCSGVKGWRFAGKWAIKCGSGRENGCQGGREGVR